MNRFCPAPLNQFNAYETYLCMYVHIKMILRYRLYVWYMCVIKYFIRRAITLLYIFIISTRDEISIQVAKISDDRHRRHNTNIYIYKYDNILLLLSLLCGVFYTRCSVYCTLGPYIYYKTLQHRCCNSLLYTYCNYTVHDWWASVGKSDIYILQRSARFDWNT